MPEDELKTCNKCGASKPLSEFYKQKTNRDGRKLSCKTCYNLGYKEYRESRKNIKLFPGDPRHGVNGYHNFGCRCAICNDAIFGFQIKRNHNVTEQWYADRLIEQNFACAICLDRGVTLYIDHDHACCPQSGKSCGTCARGLLCHHCNSGLGLFRDQPRRLSAAIDYLAA